jgi:hypothetical protein
MRALILASASARAAGATAAVAQHSRATEAMALTLFMPEVKCPDRKLAAALND